MLDAAEYRTVVVKGPFLERRIANFWRDSTEFQHLLGDLADESND
jgi:hypothetical protein